MFCPKVMPVWNTVTISKIDLQFISQYVPRALDVGPLGDGHPGPEAHQIVAMELIEEISNAHHK